jgi:hypothetical protein
MEMAAGSLARRRRQGDRHSFIVMEVNESPNLEHGIRERQVSHAFIIWMTADW